MLRKKKQDFQINILFLYNANDHKVLIEFITYFRWEPNANEYLSLKRDGQGIFALQWGFLFKAKMPKNLKPAIICPWHTRNSA